MSENMGSQNFSSENLNAKEAYSECLNAFEELKSKAADYLDSDQQESGEGQEKQPQEKTLNRGIVEQVLDQLNHFAADDAYIAELAERHVDSEDMTNIVSLREATRQKQLDVYRTVLEKAIASEAHGRQDALNQLERLTALLSGLDGDDFDEDMREMIKTKAFELMNCITAAVG